MTKSPEEFGYQAALPGQRTTRSLTDVLESDGIAVSAQLREQLDSIREAEREAERVSAQARLY